MRKQTAIGVTLSGVIAVGAGVFAQGDASNCAPDNGGITLPAGFCASVFADKLGQARHMTVSPTGDLYVALRGGPSGAAQGVVALRDADKDGKAEIVSGCRWSSPPVSSGTTISFTTPTTPASRACR